MTTPRFLSFTHGILDNRHCFKSNKNVQRLGPISYGINTDTVLCLIINKKSVKNEFDLITFINLSIFNHYLNRFYHIN